MASRRRRTGPTDTVRHLVHVRDGGRCVRCNTPSSLTIHHRVNRGMGGAREEWINQPQNLLLVCTACNSWFEDHPRESYSHGWKVRRPMLPGEMPVRYPGGTEFALHPDGSRSRVIAAPRTETIRRYDGAATEIAIGEETEMYVPLDGNSLRVWKVSGQ